MRTEGDGAGASARGAQLEETRGAQIVANFWRSVLGRQFEIPSQSRREGTLSSELIKLHAFVVYCSCWRRACRPMRRRCRAVQQSPGPGTLLFGYMRRTLVLVDRQRITLGRRA